VSACEKLKKIGVHAFAIGSKELWPTAAWFDYLDLRLNGYDFHSSLMEGRSPYTDSRVRAVFVAWGELIKRGCFVDNHASMSWQESQALIYQGKAAMMLIGNYIVAHFPADLREKMDFAPFPTIDPEVPRAEEAPMNSIHIPDRAKNKRDAKRFLAHLLRADVQGVLNQRLLLIPVNRKAELANDRFVAAGAALLDRAERLTQFFDRDTHEDVALAAMKGFQEFMIRPDRLENAVEGAERARRRVYGP
jgi:multiple sugar transport system substrate-binding protein